MINDIHGFRDPAMAEVTAAYDAAACLMHFQDHCEYRDLIEDVREELTRARACALAAGVKEDKILLDPGIGFGKTREQNLAVLAHLDAFGDLGSPVLLGASRKSVIGLTLDLPVDQRLEGTLATTALAVQAGYLFVRVHDVAANVRLIRMLEAIRAYR